MSLIFKCDKCKVEEYSKKLNIPDGWEVCDGDTFCSKCINHNSIDVVIDLDKDTLKQLVKFKMIQPIGMTAEGNVVTYKLTASGQNLLYNRLEFENGNIKKEDGVISGQRSDSKS